MSKRLEGRIALVTGASRGIGRAVAKRYAAEGATVIAVARTQGALEELDDEVQGEGHAPLVLVPQDLRKGDDLDRMGLALYERFGKLDVMVANAGVLGVLGPLTHLKVKDWDDVIASNLTAQWRLLRSLDPLLRQSDAGRAIFVTSSVAREARAYWSAYAVSKAGLEMMAKIYAEETAKTAVRANIYDPGRTATRMRAQAFPGEDQATLPPPERHGDAFVDLAAPDCALHGAIVGPDGVIAGRG